MAVEYPVAPSIMNPATRKHIVGIPAEAQPLFWDACDLIRSGQVTGGVLVQSSRFSLQEPNGHRLLVQTYWNQENVLQAIQNLGAPHGPNNRIVPLIGIAAATILEDGNPEWPAPSEQVLLDRFQVKPTKQGKKYHPHGLWIEATRGCYLEMVFRDTNHLRDVFSRLYDQQVGWVVPVMVLTSPEALWPDERIVEVWANKKNLNGHDLICFTEMNRGPVFEMPGSATVNDQFFQYLCLEKQ